MDQAPNETQPPSDNQASNEIQSFSETQAPNETQASNETQAPAVALTPLGEPITSQSASLLAEDPVKWHLSYWLHIYTIGVMRDGIHVDVTLMRARMNIELEEIANAAIRTQVFDAWDDFRKANQNGFLYYWTARTLEHPAAKRYQSDLDRMLINKEQKMQDYLGRMNTGMNNCVRIGNLARAKKIHDVITLIDRKLDEEQIARENRIEREKEQNGWGFNRA